MDNKKKNIILPIIRTALIILWVYAALSKLSDYTLFSDQLQRQPLPAWSIPVLSWLLPVAELFAAALLCFQRTFRKGLLLSFLLMLLFTFYVGFGLAHVYDRVPCSCGGILGKMGWGGHLVFNAVFTIGILIAFFSLSRKETKGQA